MCRVRTRVLLPIEWKIFGFLKMFWLHTREHFKPQIFFVSLPVGPLLDLADVVVQVLHNDSPDWSRERAVNVFTLCAH